MDITRRHFFSRTSTGIGIAALGSLLAQDGFAAAETSLPAACRGCRISRPKPSASSSCTSRAAPRRWTCSITSRRSTSCPARELPGTVRMGQRITGMTSGQSAFPVARSHLQVPAARAIRRMGQRTAAAHRQDRRRSRHHQDDEHRRHQSRSGDHVHPDRQPAARTAQHGRVGQLRPGQR